MKALVNPVRSCARLSELSSVGVRRLSICAELATGSRMPQEGNRILPEQSFLGSAKLTKGLGS